MIYLVIWILFINMVACIVYGVDKKKAEKGKWRISESTLLTLSLLGGGIGSFAGMKVFRHKTQKWKFKLGVPLLTLLFFGVVYILVVFEYLQLDF